MTRAQRLAQAQAALYLGFSHGCTKLGRGAEAYKWLFRAEELWPNIQRDIMDRDGGIQTISLQSIEYDGICVTTDSRD